MAHFGYLPMPSNTVSTSSLISRGLPNAVTYDLSSPHQVTITIPTNSTWTSGLHWHEEHTEYLCVVKGRVRVRLNNTIKFIAASEGQDPVEIRVDKYAKHEWSRAESEGEDVVVIERTEPDDGEKAIFFWNLNGVILDVQTGDETRAGKNVRTGIVMAPVSQFISEYQNAVTDIWVSFQLFVIFRNLDNFPVFWNMTGASLRGSGEGTFVRLATLAEWSLTHFILELAAVLGWMCGVEAVRRQHTPEEAFRRWNEREKSKAQ